MSGEKAEFDPSVFKTYDELVANVPEQAVNFRALEDGSFVRKTALSLEDAQDDQRRGSHEGDTTIENENSPELEKSRLELLRFFVENFDQVQKWLALEMTDGGFVEKFKIAPAIRSNVGVDWASAEDMAMTDRTKFMDRDTQYTPIILGLIIMSLSQKQIDQVKREIQEVNSGQRRMGAWEANEEIEEFNPLKGKAIVEVGGSELDHISNGTHISNDNNPGFLENTEALGGRHVPLFRETEVVTIAGGEYFLSGGEKGSDSYLRTNNYRNFVGNKKFDYCTTKGVFTGGSGIENTTGDYNTSVWELLQAISIILKDGGYSFHVVDDSLGSEELKKHNIEKVLEIEEQPEDWTSKEIKLRVEMRPYSAFVVLKHNR